MYWKHLSGFLRTAENVLQGPGRVAGGGCPRVPRRARTAALPGKGSIRTVTAVFGRRPLSRSTSSSAMCSLTTLGEHFITVLTSLRHPSEHSITSSSSISAASSVAQRGRSVPRAQRTLTRLTVLTSPVSATVE